MFSRIHLTLADIDAFDPDGPPTRRLCPLCGKDKPRDSAHRSLSLDRVTGLWKCFRCGEGGKVEEKWDDGSRRNTLQSARQNLRAAFSLSFPIEATVDEPATGNSLEAMPMLKSDDYALSKPTSSSIKLATVQESLPIGKGKPEGDVVSIGYSPAGTSWDWMGAWGNSFDITGTAGEKYLRGRALSASAVAQSGIRFCPSWSGRASVVFPIYNRQRELVAVQGRAVQGNAKRTFGSKKEGAFFAPVQVEGRTFDPIDASVPAIILVEAPIDALSLASCGFPALALCGTTGPSWLHIVCGLRRVLLAFDADDAGDNATEKLTIVLERFGAVCERLRPQGGKDWSELLQNFGSESLEESVALTYNEIQK